MLKQTVRQLEGTDGQTDLQRTDGRGEVETDRRVKVFLSVCLSVCCLCAVELHSDFPALHQFQPAVQLNQQLLFI